MPNDYDRIFKENIAAILLSLSAEYLGFKIVETREIPEKLHKTLEREPDFVKVVQTDRGEEFILHLEFQLTDDPHMLARMRTYHALLAEKHRMRVQQFVLYLGRRKPRMETRIPPKEIMTGFNLLDLQRMDADQFLRSEIPEEIILAILGDFGDRSPLVVIRLILSRLKQVEPEAGNLGRVIQQLGILSRIPNLEDTYTQAIEEMPITIDIKKDVLYLRGMKEGEKLGEERGEKRGEKRGEERGEMRGIKKNSEEVALKMLRAGSFTDEMICHISGVSETRLQELKEQLGV